MISNKYASIWESKQLSTRHPYNLKMKYLPICCFIILVSLLSSCLSNSNESPELMVFDLQAGMSHPESFVMSDIISTMSYIPLETREESLIGFIDKITIADDKFVLSDRKKGIKVFLNEGAFSHDIGGIGKGPGEYIQVRSLSWDHKSKEVVVYNVGNANLQFYSPNGHFKRSFKVPHNPMNIYPQQNGKYLGSLMFDTQIDSVFGKVFQFDTTGKVVGYGKENMTEQNFPPLFVYPSSFQMGSKDLFIPERSDTVFQVFDGQLIPIISFGLGNLMVPDEIYYSSNASSDEMSKYIYFLNGYGLNDDEFVVEFKKGKQKYLALCNIKTGKSKVMKNDQSGITNDIDGGHPITGFYYSKIQNGYLYSMVSPIYLKTNLEEGVLSEPSANLRTLINGLDVEDNPLIIKMKIRDNILK